MCSSFYQVYVSIYFIAYQDYIIKELCVQKDDQQGCNGKCYLMKNLDGEVSENNATAPSQNDKEFRGSLLFYFSKTSKINFKYASDLKSEKTIYYFALKQSLCFDKETPPPKFFS
ncbi:MAG: hypothetical protein P8K77_09595 [Polaribacter sp.]|nr:hypothetical protein [Polaribacter sp.]